MIPYREIIRLHCQGLSQRSIAASCKCSRNTVAKVIGRAKELNLSWPLPTEATAGDLENKFFDKPSIRDTGRCYPDLEHIHKEMAKSGVTLRLLWGEYCEECRQNRKQPLMYSQFCYHYQEYAQTKRATMHIPRKPGEQIEVDWAGQTMNIFDRDTGEALPAYIFIGVLSYSQYTYVEAFLSQNQESWITAHTNMYRYFGGVSRILVPDNLKTGVTNPDRYDPTINKVYQEMAEYYGTAVIPARVRKPKDKPNAEMAVSITTRWIVAALRNQKFFSITELNKAIEEKLESYNHKQFQKKDGSRYIFFVNEEKPMLLPLPAQPYEIATWKAATVAYNCHIQVEKNYYSCPSEYLKQQVDVRMTRNVIEVFYNNHRICSHVRLHGRPGQYSTVPEHMPKAQQEYVKWDSARFISWAESIGSCTATVVKAILNAYKVEQQSYRSCMGLLKLADKYSVNRLEAACKKALSFTPNPSLKSVKTILSTGQDKVLDEAPASTVKNNAQYGFVRGADYYGRAGE